jgi:hypothetical protein
MAGYVDGGSLTLNLSGIAIGEVVAGGSATAILWVDGSGNLGQDVTNLSWDDTGGIFSVNSGNGLAQIKKRTGSDIYPSLSTGSAFIHLSGIQNQGLGLTFYEFGEMIQFSGDGGGTAARSVLEFHGQVGTSTMVPIMTLVCGPLASEHEVHVARNSADDDAIINSYTTVGGPAIFTETAKSAFIDFGVRRTRVAQVGTNYFGSTVDGAADSGGASNRWNNIRWVGQTLGPNGTAGAPTYTFLADPTTGIHFDALNGFMNIAVGGVDYVGFAGNAVQLKSTVQLGFTTGIGTVASDCTITRVGSGDLQFVAAANVRFGTFSALGVEILTGYITIKDEAGNLRKVAVIA